MTTRLRVGQGIDVHALVDGLPLVLGGVIIPHTKGLEGHSDADVLLHALIDAMLGAAGRGDIGMRFPNTEQQWRGASSLQLLKIVSQELSEDGWRLVNFDSTLVAQEPKISPFVDAMKSKIAGTLNVELACCGIKATTPELMGFVGRGEGIMAHCVVLMERGS